VAVVPRFVVTNRVANPVLRRVLRTPLGRRLGASLALLRYTGTRTGQPHELVCQYVRAGATVWVLVGAAQRKTWWRNLRRPAGVELWLAGEHVRARAVAVEGRSRPEECAAGLATYLAARPRARRALGLGAGAGPAEVAARGTVLVRADLTSFPERPTT
jgi:F420H(2)-dependent quinone reductase